jgi:hypothetical protein
MLLWSGPLTCDEPLAAWPLAADAQYLYWASCYGVLRVSKSGGPPTALAGPMAEDPDRRRGLVIEGASLFWTDRILGRVDSVGLDGTGSAIVAAGVPGPEALTANGGYVYWAGDSEPRRVAISGGPIETLYPTSAFQVRAISVRSGFVYWGGRAGLLKGPVNGGLPQTLVSGAVVSAIVVDSSYVYFADQTNGAIARVPLAGGNPEILAGNQDNPIALCSDGQSLYWANGVADGTIGVMGLDGTRPDVIATNQRGPTAVAVDASFVFWVDVGLQQVWRADK